MNGSNPAITRRHFVIWTGVFASARFLPALAAEPTNIAPQPYFAGVKRALETLAKLGAPIAAADAAQIAALSRQNDRSAVDVAEEVLYRYTLMRVSVESDGYPRAEPGGANRTLVEQGWSLFLVRVSNPIGSTQHLGGQFEIGGQTFGDLSGSSPAQRHGLPIGSDPAPWVAQMWLEARLYDDPPMTPALSGFIVEYRVIQLFSRDRGEHDARFNFLTAAPTGANWLAIYLDLSRRGVRLNFSCLPSRDVKLSIVDTDGRGCVASLVVRDKFGRLYPLQAMRLAPDLPFQPQIYRADGETVRLPDGDYMIETQRGPEYLSNIQSAVVSDQHAQIEVQLKRWIDPAQWGWYSGDTHIHAAGCAHYSQPTEGVSPETIIRHVRGEALSIGEILTWGGGYHYQKQFFTGHVESPVAGLEHPDLQTANNTSLHPHPTAKDSESLIRYDMEISGFPSSHAGHLVLLRLINQEYPGTRTVEDWPSWNLPILQWAKAQGAVAGYAHCGDGMLVDSTALPNYDIPPFAMDGAHESLIDVTHGVVDFLSGCEMPPVAELNLWYHLLNCGFRLGMVGETDFPCMSDGGQRPGVGRSYVRVDNRPVDDAGYDAWVQNLKAGRLYHGDGRSHFLEFTVGGRSSGDGSVQREAGGPVEVRSIVAAWLQPAPTAETDAIRAAEFSFPSWHIERARIGNTREIAVELVVNGIAADKATMIADGTPRQIHFKAAITRSSWVALRILFSGHTHPVFIEVGNRPIRASKRSAQWCRACVDKVWEIRSPFIRESERPAAAEAFDHARKTYDRIVSECEGE